MGGEPCADADLAASNEPDMPSSSSIAAIHCQGTQEVKIGFCFSRQHQIEHNWKDFEIRPIQFLLIDVLNLRWLHGHPHVAILWICWKQETKSEY